MSQELQVIGFKPDIAEKLGVKLFTDLHWRNDLPDEEVLDATIRGTDAHWKRAEDTVASKEYWEAYFAKIHSFVQNT